MTDKFTLNHINGVPYIKNNDDGYSFKHDEFHVVDEMNRIAREYEKSKLSLLNEAADMEDYIVILEEKMLDISRIITSIFRLRYKRDVRRFYVEYDKKNEWYDLIDSEGVFNDWHSFSLEDISHLADFMNDLHYRSEDLQVDLECAKEENARLKGLPGAHRINDLSKDIFFINDAISCLIENDIEQECIEYESEQISEIAERLHKVIEPYWRESEYIGTE